MAEKWYFRTTGLIILFVSIGPFALPFVWLNPRFGRRKKVIITAITLAISFFLGALLVNSLRSIFRYYDIILNQPLI
ncbi:hypothetical protein KJ590_04225 [Patescibacteria group bacterium]|nr:hypothetical protein [Patescibacteria group bacterium]